MRKLLSILFALSAINCVAPASAQVGQIPAWPPIQPVISAGYVGPGDLGLSATVKAWGAVDRCYSTSYTGNVADIWDSATGSTTETKLTCSAGGTINQTINPLSTTCNSGCALKTMYDQSGALACGGAACDYQAQSTVGNWPVIAPDYSGGRACANQGTGSHVGMRTAAAITTLAQPFSVSGVYIRTSGTASNDLIAGGVNPNPAIMMENASGLSFIYAGSVAVFSATENVLHSFQGIFNSSSSLIYRDTSASGALNPSTNILSGSVLGVAHGQQRPTVTLSARLAFGPALFRAGTTPRSEPISTAPMDIISDDAFSGNPQTRS